MWIDKNKNMSSEDDKRQYKIGFFLKERVEFHFSLY